MTHKQSWRKHSSALGHLGYSNRKPETRWLTSNGKLFLTVLEAGKSKVKMPADSENLLFAVSSDDGKVEMSLDSLL